MIYTQRNVQPGTTVHDVEARRTVGHVLSVDSEAGEVVRACQPVRLDALGRVETFVERYRSIYPIFAGLSVPQLFHCYGRQAD